MRVVLDSSMLVRAYVSASSPASGLVRTLIPPRHRIVLSQHIVSGISRVLSYPRIGGRYHVALDQIETRLSLLIEGTEMVEPGLGEAVVLADPNDDPVLYTAVAGKVDVLCRLDRHFYAPDVLAFCGRHGIRVMKDVQLLGELRDADAGKGHYA